MRHITRSFVRLAAASIAADRGPAADRARERTAGGLHAWTAVPLAQRRNQHPVQPRSGRSRSAAERGRGRARRHGVRRVGRDPLRHHDLHERRAAARRRRHHELRSVPGAGRAGRLLGHRLRRHRRDLRSAVRAGLRRARVRRAGVGEYHHVRTSSRAWPSSTGRRSAMRPKRSTCWSTSSATTRTSRTRPSTARSFIGDHSGPSPNNTFGAPRRSRRSRRCIRSTSAPVRGRRRRTRTTSPGSRRSIPRRLSSRRRGRSAARSSRRTARPSSRA